MLYNALLELYYTEYLYIYIRNGKKKHGKRQKRGQVLRVTGLPGSLWEPHGQ